MPALQSRSPVPAAAAPAPARVRASSPRPTSRPSARPAAAPVAAAAPAAAAANGATANGLSPEQLAFLERKRSEVSLHAAFSVHALLVLLGCFSPAWHGACKVASCFTI